MIRRTRLLDRSVHQRDARFFVVATEGAETEPRYLHALQERDLVPRSRVKIHVLPTNEGRSAPDHLAARIDAFLHEYTLLPDDEVWLVLDTDLGTGNRIAQLAALSTLCKQKRWRLARELAGRNYDAILLDLDGTLVDEHDQIHPHTLRSLRAAAERGVRVMIATGRSELATIPVVEQLGIDGVLLNLHARVVQQRNCPRKARWSLAGIAGAKPRLDGQCRLQWKCEHESMP